MARANKLRQARTLSNEQLKRPEDRMKGEQERDAIRNFLFRNAHETLREEGRTAFSPPLTPTRELLNKAKGRLAGVLHYRQQSLDRIIKGGMRAERGMQRREDNRTRLDGTMEPPRGSEKNRSRRVPSATQKSDAITLAPKPVVPLVQGTVREQADAFRSAKGTPSDRVALLKQKLTSRADRLKSEIDQAKRRYDRYRGDDLGKIAELRKQYETVIPAKAKPLQKAATKLRTIHEKVDPARFGYVRGSQERVTLANEIRQKRSALPTLKRKAAADYERLRTMSGNLTRRKDNGSVRNALRLVASANTFAGAESSLKQARERAKRLTRMTNAARS